MPDICVPGMVYLVRNGDTATTGAATGRGGVDTVRAVDDAAAAGADLIGSATVQSST
jgi:hypothetical protein